MCAILGTPPKEWTEGYKLANKCGIDFPKFKPVPLSKVVPNVSEKGLNLLTKMLKYDP